MKTQLMNKRDVPLEADIEKYLVRQCLMNDWICWKLVSPGRRGVPDRVIYATKGVHALVEVKRPKGGKLSPLQAKTIAHLQEKGHQMEVINTFEGVDALIEHLQKRIDDAV